MSAPADLGAIATLVAVAETSSFRAAGDRLGVTRSAVSQTIRRLEESTGIALVQRTTRSVSLTEAGERLYRRAAPALGELADAMDAARELGQRPSGHLRLAVSSIAERFLDGPLLASFARAYPNIELDVLVTDDEPNLVDGGFDAAVRLGETLEQDMIAVPVSGDQRQLAVCAPSYLEHAGTPTHPRELGRHRCIGWRPAPGVAPYRWEFSENGREFDVAVTPEITTNDMGLMIRLTLEGAGITCGLEETFAPYLARGKLVAVLEQWCPPFQGFFLCFPSRRNLAPKLRALIDHVRMD